MNLERWTRQVVTSRLQGGPGEGMQAGPCHDGKIGHGAIAFRASYHAGTEKPTDLATTGLPAVMTVSCLRLW